MHGHHLQTFYQHLLVLSQVLRARFAFSMGLKSMFGCTKNSNESHYKKAMVILLVFASMSPFFNYATSTLIYFESVHSSIRNMAFVWTKFSPAPLSDEITERPLNVAPSKTASQATTNIMLLINKALGSLQSDSCHGKPLELNGEYIFLSTVNLGVKIKLCIFFA